MAVTIESDFPLDQTPRIHEKETIMRSCAVEIVISIKGF
jgi:hypothetical protein